RAEQGPLEAWLAVILRNAWISWRRARRLRAQPMGDHEREVLAMTTAPWEEADVEIVLTAPLSAADVRQAASGPRWLRVEVLCRGGLWQKPLANRREEWLRDYEQARQIRVPRPFPPDDFRLLETSQARLRPLAKLLGYPPNTLSVRWSRTRHRLY